MRRVLVLTNSLSGGGAERSMNLLCGGLHTEGWQVALVPVKSGPEDLVNPDCDIRPLYDSNRQESFSILKALFRLNVLARRWNPEICILNCSLPELLGALLLKRTKFIVVEHSSGPWHKRKVLGQIVRFLLRLRGAKWVSVSDHLSIWPNAGKADRVIQNAITSGFTELMIGTNTVVKRLIFIGRLSTEKRPDWIVEISIKTQLPCLLIGDGPMRKDLGEKVHQLTDQDVFLGQRHDAWSSFEAGDLLIVPSKFEGDGLVVLEGMQRRVPMLLADIEAFRRFKLENQFYCLEIADFVKRIEENRVQLENLIPPKSVRLLCLENRDSKDVVKAWTEYIDNI